MKKFNSTKSLPDNASYAEITSPVGVLTIITSPQGLHTVIWDKHRSTTTFQAMTSTLAHAPRSVMFLKVKKQLSDYFKGDRKTFDLPLVLNGTEFQKKVWQQLLKIPYGQTISYGEQATRLGDKNKARAVGLANGQNPISIIIPCHRVIGSNGKLTGFGGGLDKKAILLALEQENQ